MRLESRYCTCIPWGGEAPGDAYCVSIEKKQLTQSVKARHGQTLLLAEKEAMQSRLQAAEEERTAQVSRAESLEHRLRDTMLMLVGPPPLILRALDLTLQWWGGTDPHHPR